MYGNLFYLLQSEPKHIAGLSRFVNLGQIDTLLQTVMFTLFGNQYEIREEYLLLSMFQNVLAAEFEGATSIATVMRANTPVSRMMTTYTRY
jgi:Ras GTPase-activating-like protein IQGAP2/3